MKNQTVTILDRLRTNTDSPKILKAIPATRANFNYFMEKFNYEREHSPKLFLYLIKNGTVLTSAYRKFRPDWIKISTIQAKNYIKTWELCQQFGGNIENFLEKAKKITNNGEKIPFEPKKLPEGWVILPEKEVKNYNIQHKTLKLWQKMG